MAKKRTAGTKKKPPRPPAPHPRPDVRYLESVARIDLTDFERVDLAKHLKVDKATVTRIMDGKRALRLDEIYLMCDFYGVTPEELLRAFGVWPQLTNRLQRPGK